MGSDRITTAAGGVVWRRRSSGKPAGGRAAVEVLVVHRPRYDDWTFPKGKSDPGEALQQTAVREIAEETGVQVRLGVPLQRIQYRVPSGRKHVSYWCARPVGSTPFTPNKEVDEVRWVRPRQAAQMLSYEHDVALLDEFRALRESEAHRSRTLVVLRHGKAQDRSSFDGDDLDRPLVAAGTRRAQELIPLLGAYGVRRVVSSPAVRCAQTVEPYAHDLSTFLEIDDRLSEETSARHVARSVATLLERKRPVTLCSHAPTLPWVLQAVGVPVVELSPGDGVVVHHRKGRVIATERI